MRNKRISAALATAIGVAMFQGVNAEGRNAEIFNGLCNRCHGMHGQGVKGLEAPLIAGMPSWYVETQLKKFRDGIRGRHPKDDPGMRMRPMARTLEESDIKGIAEYVAALPPQTSSATLQGANVESGKTKFAMCMACHGPDAKGTQAMGAAALAGQSDWYLFTQLKNFKSGIRGTDPTDAGGAMMRPMAMGLDEASMRDIAAYLGSLPR